MLRITHLRQVHKNTFKIINLNLSARPGLLASIHAQRFFWWGQYRSSKIFTVSIDSLSIMLVLGIAVLYREVPRSPVVNQLKCRASEGGVTAPGYQIAYKKNPQQQGERVC